MPEFKKEQQAAVFHETGDILISASAGSGKTFVMISRAIRLICEGKADVSQILAVTFTESAAADMKEKLKKALIEKINETKDKRLIEQLSDVQTADISTMHAFCGRLIRAYFFECGLSPDFVIADDVDAKAYKSLAMDRVFSELYQRGSQDFLKVFDRHFSKRSDRALRELIERMYDYAESESNPSEFLKKSLYYYTESGFGELLSGFKQDIDGAFSKLIPTLSDAADYFYGEGAHKLCDMAKRLLSDAQTVIGGRDVYVVKEFKDFYVDMRKTERTLDEVGKAYKQEISSCRDKMKEYFDKLNDCLTDRENDERINLELAEHTQVLVDIVERFTEVYSAIKREENALDFADLEHFTLKILQNPTIRQTVRQKYKFIFVDEYQDVNGVQEEIVSLIKSDNLFMVGDVKQSIYGFRGCNPDIFRNKFEDMSKNGGSTVKLNHNFRSADAVINMVNEVFSFSMTQEHFGLDYAKTSKLISGGLFGDGDAGRAELHLLQTEKQSHKREKEEPRIYNILDELKGEDDQTSATAMLLADVIREETGKSYYDAKEKRFKPVKFGDIAILTRNKKNDYVNGVVSGLIRRGIPVTSEVSDSVCDYPEIHVLISALKLIDCFAQDIPLATVLKSDIGGFTDEELAEISFSYSDYFTERGLEFPKRCGFYDAYRHAITNLDTPLGERLRGFEKRFNDIRTVADFTSANSVLEKLIAECDFKACLYASPAGEAKVRRVERFISASVKGDKRLSVKEFLRVIENDPESIKLSECAGEDTVKVMTIHASKGLEFPVVIVCGLERRTNSQEEADEVLADRVMGFGVKYYDDCARTANPTLLRAAIKEHMRKTRMQEELRLFYVALTRATYSLHLTFVAAEDCRTDVFDGANKFLNYVPRSIPLSVHTVDDLTLSDTEAERREVLFGEEDKRLSDIMRRNFDFVYPYEADTTLPLKSNVTAVASAEKKEYYTPHKPFDSSGSQTDIERGIIAHKVLELMDIGKPFDFDGEINRIIESGLIAKGDLDKIDLNAIKRAVESDYFKHIKGDVYKEKSFIVSVPANLLYGGDTSTEVVIQGVIDLLIMDGDRAEIVDYKYSSLSAEALKKTYAKQLEIYVYAVEKILGVKVAKTSILSLLTGELLTI